MRAYELMVIISGQLDENAAHGYVKTISNSVAQVGGSVHGNPDWWGKRQFAYPIEKKDYAGAYRLISGHGLIAAVTIGIERGLLFDREGRLIVDNYPSFSVLLLREQARNLSEHYNLIATGLHMSADDVRLQVKRAAGEPTYQPILLKDDITPDELAFVEAHDMAEKIARIQFPSA